MRFSSRTSVALTRYFALALCLVLLAAGYPFAFLKGSSYSQSLNQTDKGDKGDKGEGLRRQAIPDYQLPDLNNLMSEGKNQRRADLPRPPLKPSDSCGYRDVACRDHKKAKEKIGQNITPGPAQTANQIAQIVPPVKSQSQSGWQQRWHQWAGALTAAWSAPTASTNAKSFVPNAVTPKAAAKGVSAAAAYTPPSFSSLMDAQLDPHNRMGGAGEDLFSGNYHWSLPLVSLPGRAGLDLNITLHYNSLIWARYGSVMEFDHDYYPTLTPGFRLGFPDLNGSYGNLHGTAGYVVILPSGQRVEMRVIGTNTYEAIDSSYFYLMTNPAGQSATLFGSDGMQYRYTMPGGNGLYRCTKVVDRNGNCITINYVNLGTAPNVLTTISNIIEIGRAHV